MMKSSTPSTISLDEITPLTSHNSNTSYQGYDTSFITYLEPYPVLPPDYATLPPGGCPKFPVFNHDDCSGTESLPDYSPSIYKLGSVGKKVEWLNPYEPSTSRSWKNVIMELNSTQLNFYSIPTNIEPHIMSFQPLVSVNMSPEFNHYNSQFTNNFDYQLFKYCEKLNLLHPKRLIRSYSLQYCKIGLATDYKKRANVLRIRIESEQLLLYFNNTNDLINWNLAINVAKDLLLDLNVRELPKYRTVPRRRRNRSRDRDYIYGNITRNRSYSDPLNLINSKFTKLKLKLKRDLLPDLQHIIQEEETESLDIDSFNPSSNSSTFEQGIPHDELDIGGDIADDMGGDIAEGDEDADDISDLHLDDEDFDDDPEISRLKSMTSKWNPYYKPQTQRRYYKNCLRCIKPLTSDDSWVSKSLVKPTLLCPDLKFKYGHSRAQNHYVKEFVVGSHGLIPKDQLNV